MKKLAFALLVLTATAANAQHIHNHYYGGYRSGWVGPAIVGGVIGYNMNHHDTVIVQQQPTVIVQPQVAPQGYHYVTVMDPMCNCYKQALVPN
jgi:hypothetical protein